VHAHDLVLSGISSYTLELIFLNGCILDSIVRVILNQEILSHRIIRFVRCTCKCIIGKTGVTISSQSRDIRIIGFYSAKHIDRGCILSILYESEAGHFTKWN